MSPSSRARLALMLPRLSAYGGVERFALGLAEALAGEGFDVDFICARRETEPPQGVRPVVVGRPPGSRALKIGWFAARAEAARQKGHYDLSLSMGRTVRQDLLRASGGPLSVFWERSSLAYPPGPARTFKALRRAVAPSNALIRRLEDRALSGSRAVIAVSDLVRDWWLAAHPELAVRDMRVIYNKPDLSRFAPPDPESRERLRSGLGLTDADRVLAFAGTNFMLKGLPGLIRALALLPDRCRLHVAGGRRGAPFLALARDLGLEGRVRFLGRVEDMAAFYHVADCFVLPSFYDTCSNAVLEALACGLPVISSATNGSSVFLPPDRILADPGDASALARAVESALAGPPPGPFAWPADKPAGIEPYLELVREFLS